MENNLKFKIILVTIVFLGISCAPYIKYQPQSAPKPPKSVEYNISIYHELDPLPPQSREMGKLSINNAVPSMINCDYNDVIRLAKWKVRKVGGDALHIINIKLPEDANSCYGITANIISFDQIETMFWPSINMDKNEFKEYYHTNVLDPIEGIWTVSENTDWENMLTGIKGNNEIAGKFEVAIIRDEEEYNESLLY